MLAIPHLFGKFIIYKGGMTDGCKVFHFNDFMYKKVLEYIFLCSISQANKQFTLREIGSK